MKTISFSRRLYLSVILLYGVLVTCFIYYQFQREKEYKISLLNCRLQDYNRQLGETLTEWPELTDSLLASYIVSHPLAGLRLTLISPEGRVCYDNQRCRYDTLPNHLHRPEVSNALTRGEGYVINRQSETTAENYFYSATYFPAQSLIIRTALPYNTVLTSYLQVDMQVIWITLGVSLFLAIIFRQYTHRLGRSITQLRRFAKKADRGEPFDPNVEAEAFPSGELGEISQHIVRIYQHMKQSQEDQSRIKRQLTQNISHELKTPVSSIQGYLETLVVNPDMDPERRQQYIERCYAQSHRLASLLNDISTLNRMDEELLQSITKENVNVSQMMINIVQELTLQLEERNMQVHNQLPDNIQVQGDVSLIYSIFRNLMDNAIAYAGTGTTVTVRCVVEEAFFQFSFSDNGVGIPPEHLSRIFERFYRVDKGRSRKLGGTGLGLAIVRNAVILHGGNISAQAGENGGVNFRFSIKR